MNLYGSLPNCPALYPGDVSPNLIVTSTRDAQGAGLNKSGVRSERFMIARDPYSQTSPMLRMQLTFDGDPGAIDFEIQEATNDSLTEYVTPSGFSLVSATIAADASHYVATFDASPFVGNFALIYCKTQSANAVNLVGAYLSR